MIVQKLSNEINIEQYLKNLGVDSGGVAILASKAKVEIIEIKGLHVGAANILKQDALSVGADLAVPRGTVIAKDPEVDALLIGSLKALKVLAKKELIQPFGLKEVAKKIESILKIKKPSHAEIMGIINANSDSFYGGSRFLKDDAIIAIEKMIEDGADIIDIGAVSSRPNAPEVSVAEEIARIEPILHLIKKQKLYEKVRFSIDSFESEVVARAMDAGFKIINDITGLKSDALCKVASSYNATVIIMHMQGVPQNMQQNPTYDNLLDDIYSFFQKQIKKARAFGIKDTVLDVGIGFGKTLEHNLLLLKNLEHFLTLEQRILVGASRKSMIDKISPSKTKDRLAGTLALHLEAFRNGASIVRVHDVYEHKQALKIEEALLNI